MPRSPRTVVGRVAPSRLDLRGLREHLGERLRQVKSGQTFEIMRRGKPAFVLEPPRSRLPPGSIRSQSSTELKRGSFDEAVKTGPCLVMRGGKPMAVLRKHEGASGRGSGGGAVAPAPVAADPVVSVEAAERLLHQAEASRRDVARRASLKRRCDFQIERRIQALRTCGDPLADRLERLFDELKQDDENDTMPSIHAQPEPYPALLDLAQRATQAVESIARMIADYGGGGAPAGVPPSNGNPPLFAAQFPKMVDRDSDRTFFCVEASNDPNAETASVELYFPDRASANACADELHKRFRCVWLSVWGRYETRSGKFRECWLYVCWTEATSWGDLPDSGHGVPEDRSSPVPFEQLGPDES